VRLLPRYILFSFIRPFTVSVGLVAILVVATEAFERMDRFLKAGVGFDVVLQYLLGILPLRIIEAMPIATLLAALLSLGILSRQKEIQAAMSAGISPQRLAVPLLIAGFVISLVSLFVGEWIAPPAFRSAREVWRQEVRRYGSFRRTYYDRFVVAGAEDRIFSIGEYDESKGKMTRVIVEQFQNGRIRDQIDAKEAIWKNEKWVFSHGIHRLYGSDGRTLEKIEKFDALEISLPEKPPDFIPQEPRAEEMSYRDYRQYVERMKDLGVSMHSQEIELRVKLAYPFACVIVMLLGVPLGMRHQPGKARALVYALVIGFAYFGLMEVGRAIGQISSIPPLMAAWSANIIFLCIGLLFFWRMTVKT